MQCASCGAAVGPTYRRCPSCGLKFEGRQGLVSGPAFTGAVAGASTTADPVVAGTTSPPAVPVALPPLPTARTFPIAVSIAGAALLIAVALLIGNWLTSNVEVQLSARFDGGWNRVLMSPTVSESNWLRKSELRSGAFMYELLRGNGEVLHRGEAPVANVDDTGLANKEMLTAKVCVFVSHWYSSDRQSHCASTQVEASPKRTVPISASVSYPHGGAAERPMIAFQQELQRAVFGSADQWTTVKVLPDPVRLKVWVSTSPSDVVQLDVPSSKAVAPVDLRNGDGYAAFNAAVLKAQSAENDIKLNFQFHASNSVDAPPYPPIVVVLEGKTATERRAEVMSMASRAANRIVGDHYGGGRDVAAEVLDWGYDAPNRRYSALLRFVWSGREVASNKYWIEGRMVADESGENSQFELTREGDFSPIVRAWVGIKVKVGDVIKDVLVR